MKKFTKKIIGLSVAASIFVSSISISFAEEPFLIHEDITSSKISSGVVHEQIQRFTSEGWRNINVLRVDLTDKYTNIGPLLSDEGTINRESISNMVEDSGALAGINGDFYSTEHFSYPLGAVVSDGELIVSPINIAQKLPVFSIDDNKTPFIDYWQWDIKVMPKNGTPLTVYSINKDSDIYGGIVMFDKNWSNKTLGNRYYNDMVEVIIKDNKVTDIRIGQEPIDMPENGYTLVGRDYARELLLNNFNIGDEVTLNINTSPNFENISAAIGGGTFLVKDGQVADFTLNIKGAHPRTALGFTKDKDELIMVTIDGRHSSFKGVSQETLANIMIELGAYEAINLDGGGSSTMVVAPKDEENPVVVNHPSDGNERRVVNGIGIFDDAPQRKLSYIKVVTDDTNVFVNTSREFQIKGYDKYNNPVSIEANNVRFYLKGLKGEFKKNILIPHESGVATVIAKYAGKEAKLNINVLKEVKEIQINIDELNIDTTSEKHMDEILGEFYGENDEGYSAKLSARDIKWELTGDIGSIKNNVFHSSTQSSSGAITAYIDSAVTNILVSIGYEETLVEDFENLNDIQFLGYPQSVVGSIELDDNDKLGKYSLNLKYDFTNSDETRATYIVFGENGLEIEKNSSKLGMWVYGNNSEHWLRGKLVDSNGKSYNIDFAKRIDWEGWKWVTADIPAHISNPVVIERVYLVEINPLNKDKGEILIDGLKSLNHTPYETMILPAETSIIDNKQKHVEVQEGGFSFVVSNGVDNLDNLLKYHIGKKIADSIKDSQIGVFLNKLNNKFTENLDINTLNITNGYSSFSNKNTLFVQLDDSNGGVRVTNANQWPWFKDVLNNSKEKNVVIMMPKPVFGNGGFSDKLEAKLFHDILAEYTTYGKNIWVIHGGSKNEVDLKDGIRYLEVDNRDIDTNVDIFNLKYMKFTVNGEEITYEILPLF